MPASADLAILITAKDSASAVIDGLHGKMGGFGGLVGGVASAAVGAMAAIGTGAVAMAAVGVKSAGDLEQAVANISTIKPDIDTSGVFAALNEMSTRVPQSTKSLGEGLYNIFSSLDVSQDQALTLLEKFSQGATGAQTDAETFATSVMGVMNAYGLSVEDAGHVSDVFFNTVNKGVVTGQELATSLGPVTQSAKAAGVGLNEMGAMIAAVTKEGGPASQNINNLNNFLQKITTKEAQAQLNAMGIATKDATGNFRPTTDVLEDLKEKLGGMTEAARANALQAIFPDAQARQGAMTLISQLDLVKSATLENANAQGVADAAFAKMSGTFNSQVTILQNTLMSILTTIGGALLPMLTPLVTAFGAWLPGAFQTAQAAVAPFLGSMGDIATAIMALLPIVLATFNGIAEVAGPVLAEVGGFIMETFGQVVSWFQENMPLIQQTIAVVVAAIQVLWQQHGATIVRVIQDAWTIVKTVIQGAIDIVLSVVRAGMQILNGDWSGAWQTLGDMLERTGERLMTIVGAAFDAIFAIVDDATGGMLTSIGNWMSSTGDSIGSGMQSILGFFTDGWNAIDSFLSGIMQTILQTITGVWDLIPEDIRTDLETIYNAIVERGAAWVSSLIETGQAMWTGLSQKLEAIVTYVTTWAEVNILFPIKGLIATARATIVEVGQGIYDALQGKLEAVVTYVTTWAEYYVINPIKGLIATAKAQASEVGQGIVDGIKNAISNGIGAIRDMAYRAARAALDAAKDALGIHSPSAVFNLEVGRPIVQGLMAGVEAMRRPLDSQISGLVTPPPVPSYAGVGGGVGGGAPPGAITVQILGPVYGFNDFEDKVLAAINAANRRGRT